MPRVVDSGGLEIWDEPSMNHQGRPVIVHDWSFLIGYRVQVRLHQDKLRSGQVEDVTHDGRALWLSAEGIFERQLIDQGSGYQVLLEPDQVASFRQRLAAITSLFSPPESAKKR